MSLKMNKFDIFKDQYNEYLIDNLEVINGGEGAEIDYNYYKPIGKEKSNIDEMEEKLDELLMKLFINFVEFLVMKKGLIELDVDDFNHINGYSRNLINEFRGK